MDAAGVEFDDDQNVEAAQEDRVDVSVVAGQYRLGLGGAELAPCGAIPPRGWVDAGGIEDVPDGRRADLEAQSGQFAVDSPVSLARVLLGQAQCQSLGRRRGLWAARAAPG